MGHKQYSPTSDHDRCGISGLRPSGGEDPRRLKAFKAFLSGNFIFGDTKGPRGRIDGIFSAQLTLRIQLFVNLAY